MLRIKSSGLAKFLEDNLRPNCIILFGSASQGMDNEKSDIDLFIQAKESKLNLSKYSKLLNRNINLFFEPNLKNLNKELLNNIINGEILSGYLKVF